MDGHKRDGVESRVGKRLIVNGESGRVMYQGEIDGQKGIWYGVQWDNPSRGKHSGEVNGKSYFTCSIPGSGSFIRAVPEKIDFGKDFIEQLNELYVNPEDPNKNLFLDPTIAQGRKIETYGFEKIQKEKSQIQTLDSIQLKNCKISRCESPEQIQDLLPNLKILDLSRNLIPDWNLIFEICSHIKTLITLYLTGNRLLPLSTLPSSGIFTNLKELYLNEMEISWKEILLLEPSLPNLTDLHVRENNIQDFDEEIIGFRNLKILDLEDNNLTWNSILKFSSIKTLEILVLNGNQINEIWIPENIELFPSLTTLFLDRNKIDKWTSISSLISFVNLKELHFRNNPISSGINREILIGWLEGLQELNGSQIENLERINSERYFLQWASKNPPVFENIKNLQRYKKLIEVHGAPTFQIAPLTLKENLLSLTIEIPKANKSITKKFPMSMEIRKFQSLIQKLAKIELSTENMYFIDNKTKMRVYLDDEFREFEFYGIESGTTIFIDDEEKEKKMNFSIAM